MVAGRSIRIGVGLAPVRGAPLVPITWNPADKNNAALSNSNLTATITSSFGGARATQGGTGKFYFEVSVDAVGSTLVIGVADGSNLLSINWMGDSGAPNGATMGSDASSHFGGSSGVGFSYTTADIIGVAVDVPNKLVWWSKNNVWQLSGDPLEGTGGKSISTVVGSVYPVVQGNFSTEIVTGRFTAASQSYAVPSGFSAMEPAANVVSNELSGVSLLSFAPTATATGLGTLGGSSDLTFADSGTLTGLGSVAGSSSLVLSPSGTTTGLAALLGTSALTFAPSATVTGLGSLIGSSTLVLAPSGTVTGLGGLIGSSALTFAPTGTARGLGALAGTVPLTLAGSGTLTGIGSLLASTALSFSMSGTVGTAGSNGIAGTSSLAFAPVATLTGLGQVTASTSLSLTISGQMVAGAFGDVKVRVLDEWQAKQVKVWDGVAWVEKPLKFWTGTAWRATSY